MKFELDCVRHVLLCLEKNLNMSEETLRIAPIHISFLANDPLLEKYSLTQIAYTCKKLDEGGYIILSSEALDGSLQLSFVCDITYEGHQLLEKVRNPEIYNQLKSKLGKVGSFAIALLEKLFLENVSQLPEIFG